MSAFSPIPLGQRIPDRLHAVSCSLPTMRAVRGYEEKDPAITAHLTSGYPRFVVHPLARRLGSHLAAVTPAFASRTVWLVSSSPMARALAAHLGAATGTQAFCIDGVSGVFHPESIALAVKAKFYLQNVGGFISSREAEDHLVRLGLLPGVAAEETFAGDARAEVVRQLRQAVPGAVHEDFVLANCGMNAIWAAFQAVSAVQAARGRTVWLQLGWLYLDTIAILKEFSATPADYVYVRDVFDFVTLERIFAAHGARIAGVVAEVPTNPLIQTPDLPALAALCRRHGARLLVDPSIACLHNLEVLRHADVVVTSLTKYTASEGDLTAGLCVVNPAGPDANVLRRRITIGSEPLYWRDLARLAAQIGQTATVLARIHAGTARVAEFLAGHPAVGDVHWALQLAGRENYLRLARHPGATGGMITFTLRRPGALEGFYDRLRLPKGPSFGMTTTLICPFMYLAHYDLVSTPAGLAELAASRLDPDLLRLCVGCEPPDEIIAVLGEALAELTIDD
jgi:cystathionine gamma-synthase